MIYNNIMTKRNHEFLKREIEKWTPVFTLVVNWYLPDNGRYRQPKHVVQLNKKPIYMICMIVFIG